MRTLMIRVVGMFLVPGVSIAGSLAVGYSHGCAVQPDGRVVCWGRNTSGQTGGSDLKAQAPSVVPGITNAVGISVGSEHSCAVLATGTVSCWGNGDSGQVGKEPKADGAPVEVTHLKQDAVQIAAVTYTTCSAQHDGSVLCWGGNTHGQLGMNIEESKQLFRPDKAAISDVAKISGGHGHHFCAVTRDGEVYCWGYNGHHQVSRSAKKVFTAPTRIIGIDKMSYVSAGDLSSCAVGVEGEVVCWGVLGRSGEESPIQVGGLQARTVGVGYRHACALLADRHVSCWGDNDKGQMGNGLVTYEISPPTVVSGLSNVAELSVGENNTCVVIANGDVYCWGDNHWGEAGDEAMSPVPRLVPKVHARAIRD